MQDDEETTLPLRRKLHFGRRRRTTNGAAPNWKVRNPTADCVLGQVTGEYQSSHWLITDLSVEQYRNKSKHLLASKLGADLEEIRVSMMHV